MLSDDNNSAYFVGNYADQFDADDAVDYDDYDGCGDGPDSEAIATGFERWEYPGFAAARAFYCGLAEMGYALHPVWEPGGVAALNNAIGFNAKLLRAAERKLWQICDDSKTHAEAVERYTVWAEAVKKKLAK
jgi:hypothetical protein